MVWIDGNDLSENLLDENTENTENAEETDINSNLKIKKWNASVEDLLKCWAEKAAGLSILHSNDRKYWRGKSNRISIASIIITTFSSSISLSSTSSPYYEYIMYLVGAIGLLSSLLQSLKQFYNADEKASEHRMISKQYSNYYRAVKLQLSLKKQDRVPVNEFINWAFKEYEKLIQESPVITSESISNFKEKFRDNTCFKPDICQSDLIIEINRN